jgi:hypothetical protein
MTNIPETDTTPRLQIPEDEYKYFSDEVCKLVGSEENKPVILPPVELADGSFRNFVLIYAGVPCKEPLFLYLNEVEAEIEKDAE